MTTDINSIRNNLLDFIVKREYEVNKDKLKNIGSDKDKDILLYLYLKKRNEYGYILSSKQQRALDILNSLYKDDKYNNILLSDFYTSFKTIYDIAKKYKETGNDDESNRVNEDIANNFKKLYLLYNKDVYDDLENKTKEKVFKYIKKNINKFKGGNNQTKYIKFVSKRYKEQDEVEDLDKDLDNIFNFSKLDEETKKKNNEIKEEKKENIKKNINYNILLRNLLFNKNNKVADDIALGYASAAALAAVDSAVAVDSAFDNVVANGSNGDAFIVGGADTDIIKKDIIEILKEYKDELSNIDTKTSNIINDTKTSNIINNINLYKNSNIDFYLYKNSNIDFYDNSSNSEIIFNGYEKNIDELKDNKNELEEYFKKINTIYNDINISIKGIDTEVLKDILLKKNIKEFNKFSLNDIDINIKIKEYNKLINEYPKNKEKYDKIIKKKEEIEKHHRAVELEKAKAEGIKAMLGSKTGHSGGRTDDKKEKKLNYLIGILDKIINILKNKIPSSNNGDNNIDIDSSLFEKIWSQYVKYENDVKLNDKGERTLMDAEDNFYDQINMNDLNPADVLKINSKDKYVFCALIFFIRLFIVVIINLLIEYNVIKRLDTALITYILAYVFIIIIIAIVVNLDTYKLRILLNYFNMNMNINLLILHIFIVVIFFILILIIIFDNENNKYRNNFNSIFDFSYIYFILWHLFRGRINDKDVKNAITNDNISINDKLKIQYKFEILTMIVYIFSAAIVLII